MSTFSDLDLYCLHTGEHARFFEKMGAHIVRQGNKVIGWQFRLYAPNAAAVYLVGDFNHWMQDRVDFDYKTAPFSIYEVHLGSWRKKVLNADDTDTGASTFYSYKEIAEQLIAYVQENHFTHIELLPITEHPLDASWGYQVTGYYSPASRYGNPDELKYLIDQCHQAGIGVILDWVPLHFCKDAHGLYQFDGSWLYEYQEEYDRENHQWGTANFDLSKGVTRSFLLSNMTYWLDNYHFDGIRVDALSYLLYWRGETDPDKTNGPAIDFIKRVTALVHTDFKGVVMIAEDSSAYPKVTHSLEQGGLGFDMKWDLGWMNDTLKYMSRPSYARKYHSNEITFGMYYNPSEQFLLPLSHDEVVHGKHSIVEKIDGDYEDRFRLARAYYSFYFAHPGKNCSLWAMSGGAYSRME
ncbi:alpha-amylase family glycosyl hydrolase [Streptococcus sp. X16XC17]|uniref:alpha-amylase family glycosyl hydrolase n=2 Tax=unclassified Streptococcus TaxID=2608887 RepID=UPI00069F8ABE|nr:alpha-amylase family glycosyl hydrolase [Streptococcus sp. X16XC17]